MSRIPLTKIPLTDDYFLTHDSMCWTLWRKTMTRKNIEGHSLVGHYPSLEYSLKGLFQKLINQTLVTSLVDLLTEVVNSREMVATIAKDLQNRLDELTEVPGGYT